LSAWFGAVAKGAVQGEDLDLGFAATKVVIDRRHLGRYGSTCSDYMSRRFRLA